MTTRKDLVWNVTWWADHQRTWELNEVFVAATGMEARSQWEAKYPKEADDMRFRDYQRRTPLNYQETESWIDGLTWGVEYNPQIQAIQTIPRSMNRRLNEK